MILTNFILSIFKLKILLKELSWIYILYIFLIFLNIYNKNVLGTLNRNLKHLHKVKKKKMYQ